MAATYTQNITPFSGRYNATLMLYSFTGSFTAHTVVSFEDTLNHRGLGNWAVGDWGLAAAALPLTRSVAHNGTNIFGIPFVQDVECYPTLREVFNTTTADTLEVMVSMEGRVIGVHDIATRVQMTSEILFQSLRPSGDGTYVGLGLDFQGVPRDVPMEVYSVTQCVPLSALEVTQATADLVAGSVNELDWVPPWWSVGPPGAIEGAYLYLGPVGTRVDRNTRTALMTHEFARLQSRNRQHIFEWFEYTETWDDAAKRRARVYDPATFSGYIQKVAGTDVWWDGSTPIPSFAALALAAILF